MRYKAPVLFDSWRKVGHAALHRYVLALYHDQCKFLPKKWRVQNTEILSESWAAGGDGSALDWRDEWLNPAPAPGSPTDQQCVPSTP